MKEIIDCIINDEELNNEEKATLVNKVALASHGIDRFINDELYLHTDDSFEVGAEVKMAVYARQVSPGGATNHFPTNMGVSEIEQLMKEEILGKNKTR